jgi:putative tricarboxylic transport membrane protein
MTRRGEADLAIGWATGASVFGGLFSAVVLIFAAPQLARFALGFGPIETFALICMALTCIAGVSHGSLMKGLLAGVFGLFLATIGTDNMTGSVRFTFGFFDLSSGLALIPVLVGLFALAEVFSRLGEAVPSDTGPLARVRGLRFAPFREWYDRRVTMLRSAIIGTCVGVLPGTGAATASFIAYAEAKRSGKYRDRFGEGEPEGLVASETANNAVTGGALVPTLALGIPGDAVTAVLMSTLIIQGIQPGVRLFIDYPEVMDAAFIALIVCNIMLLVVGIPLSRMILPILRMPEGLLMAGIVVLSLLGAWSVGGRMFDIYVALAFGIVGAVMRLVSVPVAPVIIGIVLAPMLEESLRQGLILTDNNFFAFFTTEHPIAIVLAIATLLISAAALRTEFKSPD